MSTLALFDLDGTLTRGDTMLAFIRFRSGSWKYLRMLLPAAFAHALGRMGLLHSDAGKKRLMRTAFAGVPAADVLRDAEKFAMDVLPGMFREGALERLREHVGKGHRTIIVSASCSVWLEPWCKMESLELIATELEQQSCYYTGELATPNCKGEEKVIRLRAAMDLLKFERIYAYGDTPSDRPMLALATHPFYEPFHRLGLPEMEPLGPPLEQAGSARSSISTKGLVAVAIGLALTAALLITQASKPITEVQAVGSFEYIPELFPRHGDWPALIRFLPEHRVSLEDDDGHAYFEGTWRWDDKLHALRLDEPHWDRRVLWVHGWKGPVLKVASPVGKDLFQMVTYKRVE